MHAEGRLHSSAKSLSDGELVEQVCRGGSSAYDELRRRHSAAGRIVARALDAGPDADRLVSDAFERMRVALRRGDRPTGGLRRYLITSIRTAAAERSRAASPDRDLDPAELVDPASGDDRTLLVLERTVTAQAFAGLPSRWQEVLWYGVVDSMPSAETALLIGEPPHEVPDLLHRAREGLRRAWVGAHLTDPPIDSECRWAIERLSARIDSGSRDHTRLKTHLSGCTWCHAVETDADEVADRLPLVLLPLTAGTAGAAVYSAWVHAGSPAVSAVRDAIGVGAGTRSRVRVGLTPVAAGTMLVAAGLVAAVAFGPTITSEFAKRLPISSAEGLAAVSPSAATDAGDEPDSTSQETGSARSRRSGSSPSPGGSGPGGALGPFGPIGPTNGPRTPATTSPRVETPGGAELQDDAANQPGDVVSENVVDVVDDSDPGTDGGDAGPTPAVEEPAPTPTPDDRGPLQPGTPAPTREPRDPGAPADRPAAPTVSTTVAEPDGLVFPGLSGSAVPGARISIRAASDEPAPATVPELASYEAGGTASEDEPEGQLEGQPAPLASVVAGADGTWAVTEIASLGFGSHRLVATQTSPLGISSPPSAPVTIDLDTVSITSDATLDRPGALAVSIRAEKGATIEIGVDGDAVREIETTSRSTSARVRLTTVGEHVVSVRYLVVDADGTVRVGPTAETRVTVE